MLELLKYDLMEDEEINNKVFHNFILREFEDTPEDLAIINELMQEFRQGLINYCVNYVDSGPFLTLERIGVLWFNEEAQSLGACLKIYENHKIHIPFNHETELPRALAITYLEICDYESKRQ